jgi:hypothetical protein
MNSENDPGIGALLDLTKVKVDSLIQKHEEELKSLKATIDSLTRIKQEEVKNLEVTIDSLTRIKQEEVKNLEETIDSLNRHKDDELNTLRGTIVSLVRKNEDLQNEIEAWKTANEEQRKQNSILIERSEKVETSMDQKVSMAQPNKYDVTNATEGEQINRYKIFDQELQRINKEMVTPLKSGDDCKQDFNKFLKDFKSKLYEIEPFLKLYKQVSSDCFFYVR